MQKNPSSLEQLVQKHLTRSVWATRIPAEARALIISDADRKAAWEFYVELVTRVATQPLDDEDGVEQTALESVAGLFGSSRQVMRSCGPGAASFAALALALLNYRVRLFTAPWHKRSTEGRLADPAVSGRFRQELGALQQDLRVAADAFAAMADIPRLTDFSPP